MQTTGKLINAKWDCKTLKTTVTLDLDVGDLETLNELNEEKLSIEIKKYRKKRTLDENALFHVLVQKLAEHYHMNNEEVKIRLNLDYGTLAKDENGQTMACKVPKTVDMTKFYKYAKWYKTTDDGLDCYMFYKATHTLDTKEMSRLIDGTIEECKFAGIETKSEEELVSLFKEAQNVKKK